MAYVLPKEISSSVKLITGVSNKLTKNLYVFDLVFMGIFMCVVWILNFLVYPPLRTFYYIFMAIMGLYFRSNSSINPKRRKYQSIYYALVRNRKAYIRE